MTKYSLEDFEAGNVICPGCEKPVYKPEDGRIDRETRQVYHRACLDKKPEPEDNFFRDVFGIE